MCGILKPEVVYYLINAYFLSLENIAQTVFSEESFEVSAMCHPTGYGDKLLLGSSQGSLQLWKCFKNKPLYWFKGFDSPVTCLVQAPSPDVCAIGLANGEVVLHNLRYDTSLISVTQDGGAVTTIEFRSGNSGLLKIAVFQKKASLNCFFCFKIFRHGGFGRVGGPPQRGD